jgi:hypothetical protein
LKAGRIIAYSGQQINDRYFEGNNGDFVGASFLYNHNLSKEQRTVAWLKRMNATALATNDSVLLVDFKPTKYLGHKINANTTGIADLRYRLSDSQYDLVRQNYPALSEGDERYYGTYNLSRKIEMRSTYENNNDTEEALDSWLPCCDDDWSDIGYLDLDGFGVSAKKVFDCTCTEKTDKV